ncbi:MAG: hypothetical protein IT555_08340 [Acetobacteraceae bacterium]|nr:hypothetical protein [Acetobacteraceae bacterium]
MDALIGHTGFVGGNLLRQHDFAARFNTANIEAIAGRDFETLVFSGAQAKKWWANQNPAADRAGIQRALDAMRGVTANRVVLISTIDVVPPVAGADEGFDCTAQPTHPYGEHRLWLEGELRARHPAMLTVRLPGLFGPGLQKNILYDLLHDNQVDRIDPAARFQFYDLAGLWADIGRAQAAGLKLVHLVPAPVATSDIIARFFPAAQVAAPPASGSPSYDFRTRHAAVFGGSDGYIQTADEVFRRLAAFIAAERSAP